MLGIIARLPQAFGQEFVSRLNNLKAGGMFMFLVELVILVLVICASILLVQGTRKVPVHYAKSMYAGQ
jgi:preprotein translocase subunit SecY